jgi:heme A synthase
MKLSGFARYAWGVVAFNILVILWGAFVRASGSGAGCGSHWPSCNGEIIPRAAAVETLVEFTHRLTSGVALLLVIGLVVWAVRSYPRGDRVRQGAYFSMGFIILEALLGAGLVLFELVAENASLARAIAMAVHLANTFFLLAALSLTAWWASGGAGVRLSRQGAYPALFGLGFAGVLALGMSGAITALGDTLFPAASLAEGLRQDFSSEAHFLLQLRIYHPLIALICAAYLFLLVILVTLQKPQPAARRLAWVAGLLFVVQLMAGAINLVLLAPVWMQIVHLLLADLVWISLVLLAAATLTAESQAESPVELPAAAPRPAAR